MKSWYLDGVDLTKWLEYQTTNKYKKPNPAGEIDNYYLRRWYQNGQIGKGPVSIVVNLTNKCNLRCSHCSRSSSFDNQEMPIEHVLRILEEASASKVFMIVITGGEPLIHSRIMEIIDKIKQYGFPLKILTNLNLDSRKLETILDMLNPQTDIFQVSMDDVADQYERIRKGASFEKLSRNIEMVKNRNFETRVNMVVTNENISHMKYVFDCCVELGIDSIRFTPYFGKDSTERLPGLEATVTAFDSVLDTYSEKNPQISISSDPVPNLYPIFEELKRDPDFCYGTDYYMCPACVTNMEINIHGDAYPCAYLDDKRFYGGNILTDSLESIWQSDIFQHFREYVSDDEVCGQCSQREHCRGGCKADIIVHQGCLNGHENGCRR